MVVIGDFKISVRFAYYYFVRVVLPPDFFSPRIRFDGLKFIERGSTRTTQLITRPTPSTMPRAAAKPAAKKSAPKKSAPKKSIKKAAKAKKSPTKAALLRNSTLAETVKGEKGTLRAKSRTAK
jgi:hypothetical protein